MWLLQVPYCPVAGWAAKTAISSWLHILTMCHLICILRCVNCRRPSASPALASATLPKHGGSPSGEKGRALQRRTGTIALLAEGEMHGAAPHPQLRRPPAGTLPACALAALPPSTAPLIYHRPAHSPPTVNLQLPDQRRPWPLAVGGAEQLQQRQAAGHAVSSRALCVGSPFLLPACVCELALVRLLQGTVLPQSAAGTPSLCASPPPCFPPRLPHPCFHCCRRSDASWVKINAGQYGFYRMRYSLSNGTWAALAGAARWAGRERAAVQPVLLPPAPTFAASVLWVCFPAALSPRINRAPRPIHTCPQGPRPSW